MNTKIDYDVTHYTIQELLAVLNLHEDSTVQDVMNITNEYIYNYTLSNNKVLLNFFTNIQKRLSEEFNNAKKIAEQNNEFIDTTDKQNENKSDNTFSIPIKKDKLNPNLENVTTRLISLDSLYRQSSNSESSTDYTLDLSDPLTNVLNFRLYSIQIPFSWYLIDAQYNNNTFWLTNSSTNSSTTIKITMESGNYTPSTFVSVLNSVLQTAIGVSGTYVSYQEYNGKITINLSGTPYGNTNSYFTFFDFDGELITSPYVNGTLGWLMGFRDAVVPINLSGNLADCVIDLYGTKNLLLVIEDFNQNHVNNSLISITETSKVLALPNYYRPDFPFTVQPPLNLYNNNLTDFADNTYITNRNIPIMNPTSPRVLTQAQIYTINEIMKNREKSISYRIKAPTLSDIFAIIPIKRGTSKVGDCYIEFGSSLQVNKRIYFGPVNIERLRIKLLDDKGNVINLNGMEWSVTLISENLYQY